jgi:diguanylate cyclase (GGDEF)-like protein
LRTFLLKQWHMSLSAIPEMRTVVVMSLADGLSSVDIIDSPHARQLRLGFPWLTFEGDLEAAFRRSHFDENISHTRVNLVLAIIVSVAFSAMDSLVLGAELNRIPSLIHMLIIIPVLLIGLASSFSQQRHRIYPLLAMVAVTILGLSVATIQIIASAGGVSVLFPCVMLTVTFIYFMGGLIFYHAVAANVIVMFSYLALGTALALPGREFGYDALALIAANLFGASVVYMHEKTSRMRFLEACLLREMVARDGLTGIQNRRMFDQHIARVWQQAVRDEERVAVLLVDIDCFKDYNDRYGHQAGDHALRLVAQVVQGYARRPLDIAARYGGEEFVLALFDMSGEHVQELAEELRQAILALEIVHEDSPTAPYVTASVGVSVVRPRISRSVDGAVQLADEALYSAKREGRNSVKMVDSDHALFTTGSFRRRA